MYVLQSFSGHTVFPLLQFLKSSDFLKIAESLISMFVGQTNFVYIIRILKDKQNREQRKEKKVQKTEKREQRRENREQRTEYREQRTENREQRTENREQRTENREQRKEN